MFNKLIALLDLFQQDFIDPSDILLILLSKDVSYLETCLDYFALPRRSYENLFFPAQIA